MILDARDLQVRYTLHTVDAAIFARQAGRAPSPTTQHAHNIGQHECLSFALCLREGRATSQTDAGHIHRRMAQPADAPGPPAHHSTHARSRSERPSDCCIFPFDTISSLCVHTRSYCLIEPF